MSLPKKIVTLHHFLKVAGIDHAFGGALALAWCTEQARGTIDIDLNVFVDTHQAETVMRALPKEVVWSESDLEEVLREGQVRVWWDKTPLDLFLNTLKLHEQMSRRIRWEMFTDESIPFLSCQDIAILKVFFNRTKDWADLEAMVEAGTIRIPEVTARIIEYLGADDERVVKLADLSKLA